MEHQSQSGPSHRIGGTGDCVHGGGRRGVDLVEGEEKELTTGVGRRSGRASGLVGFRVRVGLRRRARKSEEDGVGVDLVAWEDAVASRRRRGERERERERGVEQ
jgi:hypothetical protein